MLGPHSLRVSLTSSQETGQSLKAPHHSSVCIKDPSHTWITSPPLELPLEESYIASTHVGCELPLFLFFCRISQSGVFLCFKVSHSAMISPWTTLHALALTYVMWALSNTKCGCLHFYIFFIYWFTQLHCSWTKTSPKSCWVVLYSFHISSTPPLQVFLET